MYRTPGAESDPGAGALNASMASVSKTLYNPPNTRVCYFYKDGDVNHQPVRLNVNPRHYSNIERLAVDLQKKIRGLPNGVRSIYTPGGNDRIRKLNELQDEGRYVVSTHRNKARGVDIGRVHMRRPWRLGRPPSARKELAGFLSESQVENMEPPSQPRPAWTREREPVETLNRKPLYAVQPPKKIEVMRNGDPSQKHIILLNRRTAQTFEQVVDDLGQMFQIPAKRLFTLQGRAVKSLSAIFNGPTVYVLSRGERFIPMGALSDPGALPLSGVRRKAPAPPDTVATKIKTKRARLSKTKGKWKVWVTTNDYPSAGTQAQIMLTVYGSRGNSGPIPLGQADGQTFQPGNIDEFEVSVGNIGEIYKIRISHDNLGENPGWLLEEVRMKDIHTDEQLTFPCKRWLSREEDDLEICRELPAVRPGEAPLPITQYEIRVFTGDVWNGGTDANVYITMYGQKGDTGVRQLIKSNMANKFDKGNEDMFIIEAVSLGNLSRVIIGHDGTSEGQGWYLDKIVVKEMPRGMTWVFPCDRWLDEDEDDKKIVRELKVLDEYADDLVEKAMWDHENWKFSEHTQVLLYSKTTQLPLRIKQDGAVDASGEHVDAFAVFNVLGKKNMVRIMQCASNPKFHLAVDNGRVLGLGKGGAYCEFKIRVQKDRSVMLESNKYPLQFINIQLGGKPGDPRQGDLSEPAKQFYVYPKGIFRDQGVIIFNTSLKQALNIDHNNSLYAKGKRNNLAQFKVHKIHDDDKVRMFESVSFPGHFMRIQGGVCDINGKGKNDQSCYFRVHRARDTCAVSLESLASPGIKLGMTKDGKVKPTVDTGDKNTIFHPEVVQWGRPRGTKNTFATEVPEDKPKQKNIRKPRKTTIPDETPGTPQKVEYDKGDWKLLIATEDSARDGRVVLVVYGDKGCSGDIVLGDAGANNMFQAGNQDQFKINLSKVGTVYKIRLELHPLSKDVEPYWKVKELKMQDVQSKETLKFRFNCVLSRDSGDGTLMCEVAAVRPAQDVLSVHTYRVAVETSSEAGADTEATVYVTLFGERGDTGKRRLVRSDQPTPFQLGQTDSFAVEAVSLGALQSCVVSHDGTGPSEGWRCERVVVSAPDIKPTNFPCHAWLDAGVGDKKIERVLRPAERTPEPSVVKEKTEEIVQEIEQLEEEEVEEVPEENKYNDGDYQICITTGPDSNMATTNRVFMVVYGSRKQSEEVLLDQLQPDGRPLFQCSQTDEFEVNFGSDLGDLYKVRIGHSDDDREQGWFVEKVKLKNLFNGEVYSLRLNRWMSRLQEDHDIWREMPIVAPGKKPLPVLPYIVEIHTGDVAGAETDANVYIQLLGRRGDSGRRVLFNSLGDRKFLQGACDVFRLEVVTLEEVTQVVVGHDGKDPGAGWFCERVVVKEGPDPDALVYHYPCARWLDAGQDDGAIQRVLDRGEAPKKSQGVYLVWVTTADDSNPPNSSLATLTVYGDKGRSKEFELSSETGADVFQPGSTDQFEVAVGDLGDLYKIRIARKFDDTWEGWHVKEVKLQDKDTEKTYAFQFDRWLDLYKKDHDIACEMSVSEEGKPQLPIRAYEMHVFTGDRWAAGTDANVYVKIYGSRGDSGRRYLHNSVNNKVKFQRDQMDEFVVEAVSLGELERVIIGHDGVGHGAGLFLDRVQVTEREGDYSDKSYVFPCGRWLDDHEDDFKTERELLLLDVKDRDWAPPRPKKGTKSTGKWQVVVSTSDATNAGTHAQVFITVYGDKGNSGPLPLGTAASESDQFDQGKESTFDISVGALGTVHKVRLEHDDTNSFPSWHVKQLLIRDKATGEELCWYVNRWLARDEEDGSLCRELPACRPDQPVLPVLRYYVAVYTANVRNAGTTANVRLTLCGSMGDSGSRALCDSRTYRDPFAQGHVDVFTVEAVYLGELQYLVLEHDGTDPESAWLVQKVVVKEKDSALYENEFPCSSWVEATLDQPAQVQLVTSGLQMATELPHVEQAILSREATESSGDWVVWTHTGSHNEDPTDTTVCLALCGSKATSQRLALKYQGEEEGDVISKRFLPGATDVFRISAGETGDLMKIRIFVNSKGKNPNWNLEKIKLKDIRTKQEFHFQYGGWIRKEKDSKDEEMILELPTVHPDIRPLATNVYQVAVTTADADCAETSADIYCTLFGQYGDTDRRLLRTAINHDHKNFKRGKTDVFEMPAVDLGALKMVVIGHEAKGRGKGWLCDRVVVMDGPEAATQTVFPSSQWMDSGVGDRKLERVLLPLVSDLPVANPDEDQPSEASSGQYKVFITSAGVPNSSGGGKQSGSNQNNNNNTKNSAESGCECSTSENEANCNICTDSGLECFQDDDERHLLGQDWECHNVNSSNGGDGDETNTFTSCDVCCHCNARIFGRSNKDVPHYQSLMNDQFSQEFYSDILVSDEFLCQKCVVNMKNTELLESLSSDQIHTSGLDDHHSGLRVVHFGGRNINNNASGAERAGEGEDLDTQVVTLMVYGDLAVAGPIELDNGDNDMFAPGKRDEFDLHVGLVGEIYKIRVTDTHARAWTIQKLALLDVSTKEKLLFDFSAFVGTTGGDIRKELPAVRPNRSILPIHKYQVTIETSSAATKGSDCPDVFIRLFGDRGDSGSRHLNKIDPDGMKQLLKPKRSHTFVIEAVDLLKVTKVMITKGRGVPLSIKQVLVKKAEFTDEEYVFLYDSTIQDDAARVSQQTVLPCTGVRPALTAVPLAKDQPKSHGMWNLYIRTGRDLGDSTDVSVSMVISGSEGQSADIPLKLFQEKGQPAGKPFQQGAEDHFVFQLKENIGELERVRVFFTDPSDHSSSWYIRDMRFEDEDTGDEFVVDVKGWLRCDVEEDGVREFPVLWPGVKPKPAAKYVIKTYTGDRANAGTDAYVHIILHGTESNSGRRGLRKATNNTNKFRSGQMDRFVLELCDLGTIEKVTVGHDGSESGSGWFLDKVTVKPCLEDIDIDSDNEDSSGATEEEKEKKKPLLFPCDRWLDVGEEDNLVERVLMRAEKEKTKLSGDPWKVTVTTGDVAQPSSDDRVAVVICGENGKSERLYLGDKSHFKGRGQIDTFDVVVRPNLGAIHKIRVGFGNISQSETTWKLDMVLLEDVKRGSQYQFVYGDWLVVDESHDGWVELPLLNKDSQKMLPVNKYTVLVKTGDVDNAGTDADVYLKLIGQRGDTGKRHLKQSLKDKANKFERGGLERFHIDAVDLGDIERVLVGHTSEGFGEGWFLHSVLVKHEVSETETKKYYFHCEKWLDMSQDDGKIERELVVGDIPKTPEPPQPEDMWNISVTTLDATESAADSLVALVLYGTNGKSQRFYLGDGSQFRSQGQIDNFQQLLRPNLGEIYKLRVGYGNLAQSEASWKLGTVSFENLTTKEKYEFVHNDWVTVDDAQDGWEEIPVFNTEPEKMLPVHTYTVRVETGDVDNAATDADVYLKLIGQRGDTGKRHLKQSLKDKANKFERGGVERFDIHAVDLGDIKRVLVGHTSEGFGDGWFLKSILVKQETTKEKSNKYYFPCDRWLDPGEDDGLIERELELGEMPKTPEPAGEDDGKLERILPLTKVKEIEKPPEAPWRVTLVTGEARPPRETEEEEESYQLHTDGLLVLAVYGDKGCSPDYPLSTQPVEEINEPGHVHEFELPMTEDIGTPYKVRLGFAGGTSGQQAYRPHMLCLTDTKTGQEHVFESPAGTWLIVDPKHDGWVELPVKPEDAKAKPLPVLKYHVEVYTGSEMGAGTDSNVYISIVGERGDTGKRPLKHSRTYGVDTFEQDHMDLFELEAVQLLNPQRVIVGHDGSGSAWFLDKIAVKEARNAKKEFLFPCNKWLSDSKGDKLIERELTLQTPEGKPYIVTTVTRGQSKSKANDGAVPGAVKIVVYGDKGRSKPMTFADDLDFKFVQGQSQEFMIYVCGDEQEVKDIGTPYKVRLGLDPIPEDHGDLCWDLDKLTLKDEASGSEYVFDLSDRKVELNKTSDRWTEIPVSGQTGLPLRQYYVEVHTFDVAGAGTNAKVHIQISGSRGDTGVRKLLVSATEGAMFEQGKKDIFTVEAVDLGELNSIRLGHNGKGIGSGWMPEKILIKEDKTATKAYVFECNRWLDEGEDDGVLERDIALTRVDEEEAQSAAKPGEWRVFITSGDAESRGSTDAHAQIQVFGETDDTGPLPLEKSGQDLFEAGVTDQFDIFIDPATVGKLKYIRLWHDNTGDHPGWFVKQITLEEQSAGTKLDLAVERWLHDDKEDGDIVRDIPVVWPGQQPVTLVQYEVEVLTGEKWDGGTDAQPYITLHGELGDSGKRGLRKNKEGGDMFESGKTDTFIVEAVDLGPLSQVVIGHDRSGGGSGWFLEKIMVRAGPQAPQKYVFPCANWLDKDEGDMLTERTLPVQGTEPIEGDTEGDNKHDPDEKTE